MIPMFPELVPRLREVFEEAEPGTELAESYPLHVVAAWIGNSQAIAAKHYLQVRDEDFERAARQDGTAQNPAPYTAARGAKEQKTLHEGEGKNAVF